MLNKSTNQGQLNLHLNQNSLLTLPYFRQIHSYKIWCFIHIVKVIHAYLEYYYKSL